MLGQVSCSAGKQIRKDDDMAQHSRQVLVTSIDEVTIEHRQIPAAGRGELLINSTVVGICGSDTHAAQGRHPFIDLPYRPGHEVVGVVAEVGPGVTEVTVGERVVIEPNLSCGQCRQCTSGRYNICEKLKVFGCQTPGGMADRFIIAANRVHVVPDSMTDLQAALIEPLSTPVHAVAKAGDLTGRNVVILGAGPIGLLTLIAARHAGASHIAVTDLLASKRDRAVRLGADTVLDAADPSLGATYTNAVGRGADVVFDCVARQQSMAQAIDVAAKGASIVVVGVGAPGGTSIRLDLVQDRELRIEGALMYVGQDYRTAMSLIEAGAVDTEELITATFPLTEAAAAFAASADPEQVKVLITVDSDR
jgi:L-iditol 2-dehydrogenase